MKTTTTKAKEYAENLTGSEAYKESMLYAKFGAQIGIKKCTSLSKNLKLDATTTIKNNVNLFLSDGTTSNFTTSETHPEIRKRFIIGYYYNVCNVQNDTRKIEALTIS